VPEPEEVEMQLRVTPPQLHEGRNCVLMFKSLPLISLGSLETQNVELTQDKMQQLIEVVRRDHIG
jgi:lipoate-protein ligase A